MYTDGTCSYNNIHSSILATYKEGPNRAYIYIKASNACLHQQRRKLGSLHQKDIKREEERKPYMQAFVLRQKSQNPNKNILMQMMEGETKIVDESTHASRASKH